MYEIDKVAAMGASNLTERQADQRIADELRERNRANAEPKHTEIGALAVLELAANNLRNLGCRGNAAEVAEVRAAVAELIEADKEFDAAYAEFPLAGKATNSQINEAAARINSARLRRTAALARAALTTTEEKQQ